MEHRKTLTMPTSMVTTDDEVTGATMEMVNNLFIEVLGTLPRWNVIIFANARRKESKLQRKNRTCNSARFLGVKMASF